MSATLPIASTPYMATMSCIAVMQGNNDVFPSFMLHNVAGFTMPRKSGKMDPVASLAEH